MNDRRMRKIKFDGERMQLKWEVGRPSEPDEYQLNCKEQPRPAFAEALKALGEHVLDWIEWPARRVERVQTLAEMSVRSVSLSWTECDHGQVMGATITACLTLDNCAAPLVVTTPHKPAEPYDGLGDDSANIKYCIPGEAFAAIEKVIAEAEAYIDGHRAQMTFANAAEEPTAAAAV